MITYLPDRTVLELAGADRISFLQGLVSNDVALAAPGHAIWAALLTPQGKYLADFFIGAEADRLLLDVEAAQSAMLVQRLNRHRLRARVTIAATDHAVYAGWNEAAPAGATPDPRLPAAGWRLLATSPRPTTATPDDYARHRIALGLPDGTSDLEPDKTILLEAGFEELNGISWTKGCYMGQELTARTRYRGLVKRRLVPVKISGAAVANSDVTHEGQVVGTLRSVQGDIGLATLRIGAIRSQAELWAGATRLWVDPPGWMKIGD